MLTKKNTQKRELTRHQLHVFLPVVASSLSASLNPELEPVMINRRWKTLKNNFSQWQGRPRVSMATSSPGLGLKHGPSRGHNEGNHMWRCRDSSVVPREVAMKAIKSWPCQGKFEKLCKSRTEKWKHGSLFLCPVCGWSQRWESIFSCFTSAFSDATRAQKIQPEHRT